MPGTLSARARMLEPAAALAACMAAAVLASLRLLQGGVFSADAFVHQYWMRRWGDPALFGDPLTAELRESSRYPDGYEALFRAASAIVDPIAFGEWLGVALMALSAFLAFLIVRDHERWRPAAWVGAAAFLLLVDIHRFHGGFPRAFVHPVVLLCVLLAIRDRRLAAALTATAGALLYPPAAILAVGVLLLGAARWRGRRPAVDPRALRFALLAAVLAGLAVLLPALLAGGAPRVLTADEARAFPEFGPRGGLRVFVDFPLPYLLQNRTGLDLRAQGTILLAAAAALLLARPASARLLRPEVWAMPVAALAAFAAAQAVLFKLYLPHRYTYPIVAFGAIALAVWLRPAWASAADGLARGPRAAAAGALVTGAAVLALMALVPAGLGRSGTTCRSGPAIAAIAGLPKDAIVAGDPGDLRCLPATARRAVVTSTQLAPAYEAEYFRHGRARMFATLKAVYGADPRAVGRLRARYGATHLWVRADAVRAEADGSRRRWPARRLPYGRYVTRLLRHGDPASLRLPEACATWRRGADALFDAGCVAALAVSPAAPPDT